MNCLLGDSNIILGLESNYIVGNKPSSMFVIMVQLNLALVKTVLLKLTLDRSALEKSV